MEIIYLLMVFSVLLGAFFLGCFLWSAKNGQFDDLDKDSIKFLDDNINNHNVRELNE